MTAQELHDLQFKDGVTFKPGSRHLLENMLEEKSKKAKKPLHSRPLDPIDWALQRYPGLTREKAEAMAAMQGF